MSFPVLFILIFSILRVSSSCGQMGVSDCDAAVVPDNNVPPSDCGCQSFSSLRGREGASGKLGDPIVHSEQNIYEKEFPLFEEHRLILIPSGFFNMGSGSFTYPEDGERAREEYIDSYYLSAATTTNKQFAHFVASTAHVTDAEVYGSTFVFAPHLEEHVLEEIEQEVYGAPWFVPLRTTWLSPEGGSSDVLMDGRADHPVVHVSKRDAEAYCAWAGGMRLPTEMEWERAARGGLQDRTYCWGNSFLVKGNHMCNTFQDDETFPLHDKGIDGYKGTAPAYSFPANKYGLYNMCGNVWEWTSTAQERQHPGDEERYVQKGGSFLCTPGRCFRYRPSARISNTPDSTSANVGFRCAKSL